MRYILGMLDRLFGILRDLVVDAPAPEQSEGCPTRITPEFGVPIKRVALSRAVHEKLDLRHHRLEDLNANKAEFVDCDFSYSVFERAYFHAAVFKNCKFIGCRFYDSNLRGASFHACDFKYATVYRTLLEAKEMIAILPQEPNLKREALQNLRANAAEIGDFRSQRQFVLAEVEAAIDHLSKAMRGTEDYYRHKYPGVLEKAKAATSLIRLKLEGWIWGHGERPLNMAWSAAILIAVCSGINLFSVVPRVGWEETGPWLRVLQYCFELFFDAGPDLKFKGFLLVDYALIAMRYIYIGLFISVLFKSISHR